TPVILLSDGSLANGSEPWKVPDAESLPRFDPGFATEPNAPDGSGEFWPYLRDADTLARPWAVPGTPGLEHRIGGLEKADGRGGISYDPDNHDRMVRLRAAKIDGIPVPDVEVDDPDGDAEMLVLGWGSTYGPIGAGARRVRALGHKVAQAHLRHLNPLPANLGEVLSRYRTVVVPEMNLGQLASVLRARYLVDVKSYTKVAGLPFKAEELQDVFLEYLNGVRAVRRTHTLPRRRNRDRDRPRAPHPGRARRGSDHRREADRQGLHLRPGGALVPRLR